MILNFEDSIQIVHVIGGLICSFPARGPGGGTISRRTYGLDVAKWMFGGIREARVG